MKIIEIQISDIKIGERHRKDLGDLEGLARSADAETLYQPIGVTPDHELIFGLRRLTACRDILGWTTIHARIIDVASIAHGQLIENSFRKELTLSERVALVDALRSHSHGGDRRSDQIRNSEAESLTVDEAAKKVGLGGKDDYYRFKQVEKDGVPELMEAVDAGTIPVSLAAQIAELPAEDQQESLRRGRPTRKREVNDFYPTPPEVTKALLRHEQFTKSVLEPACGNGAMSEVLREAGYEVESSDLIDRGYGGVQDFLASESSVKNSVTNPPFKMAEEFVSKALAVTTEKVAMLLPLTFLEGRARRTLLGGSCLKRVYIFSNRINFHRHGVNDKGSGRFVFAWFVWEHGYDGSPMLDWLDSEDTGPLLPPLEQGMNEETLSLCDLVSPTDAELIEGLSVFIEDSYDIDGQVTEARVLTGWAATENVSIDEARRYFRQLPAEVKRLFDDDGPTTAA